MRLSALILISFSIWLVSCGGSAQLAQPEIRTVTYDGSDWQADDIAVSITPSAGGWRVDVASTADKSAQTLLLELRFDKSLAAQDAVQQCAGSDLMLLATDKPGGVGLGIVMPEGKSIEPGELLSFTLVPASRTPSVVVGGPKPTYVGDLSGVPSIDAVDLTWSYKLAGDYDQNSEVNIGDISAMGPRLGHSTSDSVDDEADAVVDGDGNGEVNIADLTVLGANYLTGISGYNVYGADGDDLGSATSIWLANVPFADHTKPGARLQFSYHVTDPLAIADGYFYVRAALNDSSEGDTSNIVNVAGGTSALFAVPPAGQSTIDPSLSQAPSLALLDGDGSDIEDGAPLVAYATFGGELHLAYYRDGAWASQGVVTGTQYALPQLYADGSNWYVVAYNVTEQKVQRLQFDKALALVGSEDVAAGVVDPPTFLQVDFDDGTGKTGVAYGYNVAAGGYGVQFADNAGGFFTLYPVALSVTDALIGLAFKYDANGEERLYFTHGTVDTSTTLEITSTLAESTFDGGTWGFPAPVAYPDAPLQLDLGFAADGTTPKLAFTAARDTTFPIPGNPITVSLAFDGVVGTDNAGTWSFVKYYDSTLGLSLGGGFPPTTATLELALALGNYWAREGELSYMLGNGDITFDIATFVPQSGSLDGEAHYIIDNDSGGYAASSYFNGAAGLSQSWGEHGAVHGAAYLQFMTLDTTDLLAGNFEQSSAVLFWRK